MGATDFAVDLRDIRFILFEQLRIHERLPALPKYADYDKDFYDSILEEAAKIAIEVIAPINGPGDREGCHFDGDGNVTTPKGYKEAFELIAQGGWMGIAADPEYGGMGLPYSLSMPVEEMRTGACVAMSIYPGLTTGVANLLYHFGTDEMKDLYLPRLYAGDWAGTMLLTEAGAGTAVGDNRTRAIPTETDGVYHLEGEKIFISGGDQDLTENIIHLTLARVPNAPSGTRGLSIFIVPKFLPNPDGTLGERNDIKVVGIEEKMGIHGSATCSLALGSEGTCVGYRLGQEGEGMKIMFKLMNEARIMVGIQGLSAASPAYLNALDYAKERIQGTTLADRQDPDAPRVPIVRHPDVRRMLMTMKVLVETMRSFLYTTAYQHDIAENTDDDDERERMEDRVDLFTPICKAHCSDQGYLVTCTALQVLGGYGYIGEYPIEQYVRDSKISSIYEGTNGIQAMDLLGRKMQIKGGALYMGWLQDVSEELEKAEKTPFINEVKGLQNARNELSTTAMHLAKLAMSGETDEAMLHAYPFLTMFGHMELGIHALRQAITAQAALDEGSDDLNFYKGKILNLKFYVNNILPQVFSLGQTIRSKDTSSLDEALFGE